MYLYPLDVRAVTLVQMILNKCDKLVLNTKMLVEHCALIHGFRKQSWCALVGACALIRTNTVFIKFL